MLAKASAREFLLNSNFKLFDETETYPEFAADLIQEIKGPLDRIFGSDDLWDGRFSFKDPFSGKKIPSGSDFED